MKKLKLTVFASGHGSTLEHLLNYQLTANPMWAVTGVICDNAKARVLEVAKGFGILPVLLPRQGFETVAEFDEAIFEAAAAQTPDFILLLGYLKKISSNLTRAYLGRIFNSHPSLLPKHGGKGMYGVAVHEAVLKAGDRESGVTIHEVNENYDQGRIRLQKRIEIDRLWQTHDLEAGIKKLEKAAIVEFLNELAAKTE